MRKRNRRTDKQIFLDKLSELVANNVNQSISGYRLRDSLPHWEEDKYARVRHALSQSGEISIEYGGPGGKVSLTKASKKGALSVFVSYSHKDKAYRESLHAHMLPLERIGLISSWSDEEIKAGDKWEQKIWDQMEKADICLLLVSSDFISSKFCYEKEMQVALEREEAGEARVIPIILRDCLWRHTPLQVLKVLPEDGKAIASWPNEDQAMTLVAEGVSRAAKDMQSSS